MHHWHYRAQSQERKHRSSKGPHSRSPVCGFCSEADTDSAHDGREGPVEDTGVFEGGKGVVDGRDGRTPHEQCDTDYIELQTDGEVSGTVIGDCMVPGDY